MKNSEKKMIAILVAVIIILIVWLANRPKKVSNTNETENTVKEEFVQVLDDGTKLNTSTKLNETKNLNGLKIGNIQLTEQNNQSILLADVENTTGKDTNAMIINITLLDKTGKEIDTVTGIISPVKAGEKTQLNTSVTADYANAYDFTVAIKK